MLMLISPAKTLDESRLQRNVQATQPRFLEDASQLVEQLQALDEGDIGTLMHVSEKIAALNVRRYQDFHTPLDESNAKPALFSFQGDVYKPIDALSYDDKTLDFTNQHVRILSGLYGLLRPLDYLYPYRLEMGTKLPNARGKNLYEFWGEQVTQALNDDLKEQGSDVVLNLASTEYSKAVKPAKLHGRYVTAEFKERKGDAYKVIGIHAKKARGLMVDYVVRERITELDAITGFDREGYVFNPAMSNEDKMVFTRDM